MNKLDQLLKLAQLDQMSAGPQQAQQGQMMQMLMSMLQMNQQGETAADGQDLERERMAQAASQWEGQMGLNRETAGLEQEARMANVGINRQTMENAQASQQLLGGLDLTKIMQDAQNQKLVADQKERELIAQAKNMEESRAQVSQMGMLEALSKGASVNAIPAEMFQAALRQAYPGMFPAGAVPVAGGGAVDIDGKKKELEANSFEIPPAMGATSPLLQMFRGLQGLKSYVKGQSANNQTAAVY